MADEEKYNRIKELQNENKNLENYDYKEIVRANKPIKLIDIINFSVFSFSTLFALPKTMDFAPALLIALGVGFVAKSGFKLYRISREKRIKKSQNYMTILENQIKITELRKQIINKLSKVDALDADENLTCVQQKMIEIRELIRHMPLEYQISSLKDLEKVYDLYNENRTLDNIDLIAENFLIEIDNNIRKTIELGHKNIDELENNFLSLKRVRKI